jgi:hypothetical protein
MCRPTDLDQRARSRPPAARRDRERRPTWLFVLGRSFLGRHTHFVEDMLALRRLPAATRRLPVLVQPRRTFVGGAFETDFEESRAKVRRKRIGAFLAAFEKLPEDAAALQEEVQAVVRSTLSEHAPHGHFESRDQLVAAIDSTRGQLEAWQAAGALKLDWAADRELKSLGLPNADGGADNSGSGPSDQKGASTGAEAPPQQSAAAAAYAAATPQVAPAAPADEDEPPEPDVLTDEQRKTLIGLRASVALQGLPGLWEQLSRAPADVPLPAVLEAAQALTSLEPWERLRLHLKLSRSDGPVDLSAQLKSAAVSTAEGSYPLTAVLLERFEMLSEEESSRIVELKDKAAPTLVEEIRKKPMLTRLWHRLAGGRTVDGTDREVAAADRTDIALYASLESERTLQEALTKALFSYHDRLSTRRRRRRNAVKYTLLFFSLNILDFVITNM